jgi:hypothetical protein
MSANAARALFHRTQLIKRDLGNANVIFLSTATLTAHGLRRRRMSVPPLHRSSGQRCPLQRDSGSRSAA